MKVVCARIKVWQKNFWLLFSNWKTLCVLTRRSASKNYGISVRPLMKNVCRLIYIHFVSIAWMLLHSWDFQKFSHLIFLYFNKSLCPYFWGIALYFSTAYLCSTLNNYILRNTYIDAGLGRPRHVHLSYICEPLMRGIAAYLSANWSILNTIIILSIRIF